MQLLRHYNKPYGDRIMINEDIALMIKIEQLDLFKNEMGLTFREASEIFDQYNVWEFIDDMYEYMHIQGDTVSFSEIQKYLNRKGCLVA
jgi:hypothetical protein